MVLIFIFSFFTQMAHANLCTHHKSHHEITKSHDHSDDHHHDHADQEADSTLQSNNADESSQHASNHCRFHCCSNHIVMVTQNNRFHHDDQQMQFSNHNEAKQIHFHSSLYRPPIV